MDKLYTSTAWIAVAAVMFLFSAAAYGQDGWGGNTGLTYYQPQAQEGEKKLKILEVHAGVAVQEGVVAPGGGRSPLSLRATVGVNLLKFNIPKLGGRILHGPFFTFPFSIEIGFLQNVQQYAPGIGWQFSGRPSKHWKWIFGPQVSVVAKGMTAFGLGVFLGAVYYFLSGFGMFAEVNMDAYFGSQNAFVFGGSAGLLITYELFKPVKDE